MVDLVGPLQCTVDAAAKVGDTIRRIQALVGIHLSRIVGVRRHLPSTHIDRLQPRLHLLHRLIAGHCAQGVDIRLGLQQLPQPLRSQASQRVLNLNRAAQPQHILRRVGTLYSLPSRVVRPLAIHAFRRWRVLCRLLFLGHLFSAHLFFAHQWGVGRVPGSVFLGGHWRFLQ